MCSIGKPRGVGRLIYTSARADARPRIESNLLLHPDDHRNAVEAMELAALLAAGPSLRELAMFLWAGGARTAESGNDRGVDLPGLRVRLPSVRHGPRWDPTATLWLPWMGHGRVRGVEGLVVADASIMPTIPSANINLATLMIGERFGEWIREGWFD